MNGFLPVDLKLGFQAKTDPEHAVVDVGISNTTTTIVSYAVFGKIRIITRYACNQY